MSARAMTERALLRAALAALLAAPVALEWGSQEKFFTEVTKPVEDIGYLSIAIELAFVTGVAVSLWAPFAAAMAVRANYDLPIGARLGAGLACGAVAVVVLGAILGIVTALIFHENTQLPAFVRYAVIFVGLAGAPGAFALPIVYGAAERLARRVEDRRVPSETPIS